MPSLIEDYAIVGDTHSCALVGKDGSIDWMAFPRFDSPACFAALLGDESNGHWRIAPAGDVQRVTRHYHEDTLVLETLFETADGSVALVDFMTPRHEQPVVVRIVEGRSGRVPMRMDMRMRFDYGSIVPWVRRQDGLVNAVGGPEALTISTPVGLRGEDLSTVADFAVSAVLDELRLRQLARRERRSVPQRVGLGERGDAREDVQLQTPAPELTCPPRVRAVEIGRGR